MADNHGEPKEPAPCDPCETDIPQHDPSIKSPATPGKLPFKHQGGTHHIPQHDPSKKAPGTPGKLPYEGTDTK